MPSTTLALSGRSSTPPNNTTLAPTGRTSPPTHATTLAPAWNCCSPTSAWNCCSHQHHHGIAAHCKYQPAAKRHPLQPPSFIQPRPIRHDQFLHARHHVALDFSSHRHETLLMPTPHQKSKLCCCPRPTKVKRAHVPWDYLYSGPFFMPFNTKTNTNKTSSRPPPKRFLHQRD